LQCVAVCCRVLQCVAVCCSVLQSVDANRESSEAMLPPRRRSDGMPRSAVVCVV